MYLKCNGTVCKMKNWQLMLQIHLLDTPHVFIMVNEFIILPNKKHEYLQTIHAPKLLVENYTCKCICRYFICRYFTYKIY